MNIEQLRAKVKALEEGRPKSKKWKPKTKHNVRLLPLPGVDDDIAFVIKWHYGVQDGKQMACPTTWGDECAFCIAAAQFKSFNEADGTRKSDEKKQLDWQIFKKIDAATKHYCPMVERLEKDGKATNDGPYLWEMTPKSYQKLLSICANDDWNEDHPEGGVLKVLNSTKHGLDLVVELKPKNTPGNATSYDLTAIDERKKFSVLTKEGDAAVKALLEKIPGIESIAKPVTYAESETAYTAWAASLDAAPSGAATGDGNGNIDYGAEYAKTGGDDADAVSAKLDQLLGDR